MDDMNIYSPLELYAYLKAQLTGESSGEKKIFVVRGAAGIGKSWVAEHLGKCLKKEGLRYCLARTPEELEAKITDLSQGEQQPVVDTLILDLKPMQPSSGEEDWQEWRKRREERKGKWQEPLQRIEYNKMVAFARLYDTLYADMEWHLDDQCTILFLGAFSSEEEVKEFLTRVLPYEQLDDTSIQQLIQRGGGHAALLVKYLIEMVGEPGLEARQYETRQKINDFKGYLNSKIEERALIGLVPTLKKVLKETRPGFRHGCGWNKLDSQEQFVVTRLARWGLLSLKMNGQAQGTCEEKQPPQEDSGGQERSREQGDRQREPQEVYFPSEELRDWVRAILKLPKPLREQSWKDIAAHFMHALVLGVPFPFVLVPIFAYFVKMGKFPHTLKEWQWLLIVAVGSWLLGLLASYLLIVREEGWGGNAG